MSTPFRPRVVSLFSGIGATDLALEHLGCETVAHSDIEPYANAVFAKRFPNSKQLGSVTDITEVPACEVMAGGFPCQDISNAGLRAGIGGERSGLWGQFARLIGIARPKIVLIENVSALLSRGLDVVLADLAELGYACEWDCIPAAAVGAPHLRDRIWITAYHEDEEPVREDPLERSLGTLGLPPSKWPRAGRMCQGAVYVREPLAKRKTKRLNPGSAWVGAQLTTQNGWWHERGLWPTPAASLPQEGEGVETWEIRRAATKERVKNGNGFGVPLSIAVQKPSLVGVSLYPTPTARDRKDTGDLSKVPEKSLLPRRVDRIERGLWPTPTAQAAKHGAATAYEVSREPGLDNLHVRVARVEAAMWATPRASDANGAGRHGNGGLDLRTQVDEAKAVPGQLHPTWVEWVMGFPLGWTDLDDDGPNFHGWNHEPRNTPRVGLGIAKRTQRLHALGNGQVPQVMHWWAAPAIERLK